MGDGKRLEGDTWGFWDADDVLFLNLSAGPLGVLSL